MKRRLSFWPLPVVALIGAGIIFFSFASHGSSKDNCPLQFRDLGAADQLELQKKKPGEIWADSDGNLRVWKTPITGDSYYPLPVVIENLGLTKKYLAQLPKRSRVLSVGEGLSGLLDHLHKDFPNTRAVDIWYGKTGLPAPLQTYVDRHRGLLIGADSNHLPLADKSIDLVVSHMLLNNFEGEAFVKSIEEMVRVLAPRGEARIAMRLGQEGGKLDQLAGALGQHFGADYEVSVRYRDANFIQDGKPFHLPVGTLTIRNKSRR